MRTNYDEQNERLVEAIEGMYSRLADVAVTLDRVLARLDKPIAMMQVPVPPPCPCGCDAKTLGKDSSHEW